MLNIAPDSQLGVLKMIRKKESTPDHSGWSSRSLLSLAS